MKKQLLIAAVAATMGTAALADISITGNMKVNYTNADANGTVTNSVNHEANLAITGKTGDTTVYAEFALDDSANDAGQATTVGLEDVHLTTTIGDFKIKTGAWNGSDTILAADSTRTNGNYIVSTSVAGVGVSVEGDTLEASTSVKISGTVSGVALSYKAKATSDEITAAGTVGGVALAFHNVADDSANTDKSSFTASYETNGVTLSYAQADADTNAVIGGDSYFGNVATLANPMAAGDDVQGFGLKTALAGNTVQFKHISIDDVTASQDSDINKIIVTRALAGGTTFEMTYTDEDNETASLDKETLDLELSVKF
jgi:hypothetical protein